MKHKLKYLVILLLTLWVTTGIFAIYIPKINSLEYMKKNRANAPLMTKSNTFSARCILSEIIL